MGAIASSLFAQAAETPVMEVLQSSGFVEVLLPDLGWRQAVIGRQVPAGSVMTSWIDANASIGYGDSVVALEPFSHVTVVSLSSALVRMSLESGGIGIKTPTIACEIAFRGMVVRIEKGAATLSDATLKVTEGSAVVTGAGSQPIAVAAGKAISLLATPSGPVFTGPDH
jgi:hypothetical protein